ncbi:trace amine-associated receptor 13c-like protein [Lates japonicus]|uniref:Trace amine-associated receptor 13c-like protein n=1 Tax=Lates japonicus TaxID=270547 RepID=A0AAD3N340_LATJO|nr:trace amine-associated receptor 13c-like protein [Lates japonicus]
MMETLEETELCFPQHLNSSCRKPKRPHTEAMLIYILLCSISVLTVTLNLLVIISISHFNSNEAPQIDSREHTQLARYYTGTKPQPDQLLEETGDGSEATRKEAASRPTSKRGARKDALSLYKGLEPLKGKRGSSVIKPQLQVSSSYLKPKLRVSSYQSEPQLQTSSSHLKPQPRAPSCQSRIKLLVSSYSFKPEPKAPSDQPTLKPQQLQVAAQRSRLPAAQLVPAQ